MSKKVKKNVPQLRFPEFEEEWTNKNLVEISVSGFSNGVFNDPSKVGRGYRLINVKDMYSGESIDIDTLTRLEMDKKEFLNNQAKYGDIFFTRSSLVKEGIAHSNVLLSQAEDITYDGHLIKLSPRQNIYLPQFIAAALKNSTSRRQLVARGKTGTMTTIGQEDIATVKLAIPPIAEQEKIASFLGVVDTRLAQLRRKHELLLTYKRGVMQKLFSQQIRFKNNDGQHFPNWERKILGEIANVVGGGTPDTDEDKYWGGQIQWFTPTELKTKYISNSVRTITDIGLQKSSAKLLPIGTLLFSSRATVGDVSITLNECATNQGFQSLIVNSKSINEFLYYWIIQNKKTFLRLASGSTFLEISKQEISKIMIYLPCIEEQEKIADFFIAIDQKIEAVAKQIKLTEQFKKGLLQKMFV